MKTLKGADLSGETKASKLTKIKQKGVFIYTYVTRFLININKMVFLTNN